MSVVSDSAFPCSTELTGRILTQLKDGDIDRIFPSLRSAARTAQRFNLRAPGCGEGNGQQRGMGSIQKVYSRLNLPLPYDPDLRGLQISSMFRLANYRVRTVGIFSNPSHLQRRNGDDNLNKKVLAVIVELTEAYMKSNATYEGTLL